jgi:hypothetical protein
LFERESVQRHIKKSGAAREEVAADVEGRVGTGCWWDGGNTSDILTKCGANGAQRMPDKDNFGAVLQPFDRQTQGSYGLGNVASTCAARDFKSATDLVAVPVMSMDEECNPGIEMIGPIVRGGGGGRHDCVAVPYTKAKRAQSDTDDETWVEGQVNPTLSLFDCGDVRATTIAIQENLIGRDKGGPTGVGASTDGVMYTMTKADVHGVAHAIAFHPTQDPISSTDGSVHAMGCGSSGGCATQAVAFPINTMTLGGRPDEANDRKMTMGVGADGDPQFTLQVAHSHAVGTDIHSCVITGDVAATMGTKGSAVNGHGPTLMQAMTVRRLTVRECERLQAFPDDYTLIPWRKKAAGDCPDGPRYKALGNSMAVNCMEWIGERIAAVEAGEDK